jgi:hypothetical protein
MSTTSLVVPLVRIVQPNLDLTPAHVHNEGVSGSVAWCTRLVWWCTRPLTREEFYRAFCGLVHWTSLVVHRTTYIEQSSLKKMKHTSHQTGQVQWLVPSLMAS